MRQCSGWYTWMQNHKKHQKARKLYYHHRQDSPGPYIGSNTGFSPPDGLGFYISGVAGGSYQPYKRDLLCSGCYLLMLTQFIDIKDRLWGISWGPSETTTVGDIWFAHVFNLVRLYTKKQFMNLTIINHIILVLACFSSPNAVSFLDSYSIAVITISVTREET